MEDQNNEVISVDEAERQADLLLSTILGIPDDIIVNILERLPIKSLLKLKPVSDIWQDLFSYPIKPDNCYSYLFRISYLTGFIIDNSLFANFFMPTSSILEVKEKFQSFDFKSFSFLSRNFDNKYRILGSSNGFLLFSRTTIEKTTYEITNPFTKQTVILPYTPEPVCPRSVERSVCFACEQDYTRCLTRYSVMFLNNARDGINVNIFTSKKHPIDVKSFIQGPSSQSRKAVGAINNIFYWIMVDSLAIVAIDVNGRLVGETYLRFLKDVAKHCWCIFEGSMYCALIRGNYSALQQLELWVSRTIPGAVSDDDFDWERRYWIITRLFSVDRFVGFDPRDPKTIFFTTSGISYNLKSYNFQTEEVQTYDGNPCGCLGCLGSFPCEWFPWPLPLRLNV